jgi:predicted DNA-binding protein with PD1-like motif
MRSKLVSEKAGQRTFVLVLDPAEEAFGTITDWAADARLKAASLSAIGGFESAELGWFDPKAKIYRPIKVDQQCEALSLLGDIAVGDDGKPSLHIHCVVGLRDGTTRGGHLLQASVRPTLEVTLIETAAHLRRRKRLEYGIALIDLS